MAEEKRDAERIGGEYMIQDRDHEVGQMGGEANRGRTRQFEQSQGDSRQQGSGQGGSGQQGGEPHRKDRRA